MTGAQRSEMYGRALPFHLDRFMRLSREANLIVLSGGLASLPFGYLMIIQSIYLKMIGIEEGTIGLILSVTTLTGAVLTVPFGILADRYSKKWVLMSGGFISGFAWLMYALTQDVGLLLASSVLQGLSYATFGATTAMLAEKTSEGERTVAFSLSNVVFMAGSSVGALASGIPDWLIRGFGQGTAQAYAPLFVAAFALCALSSLVLIPLKESPTRQSKLNLIPTKSKSEVVKLSVANVFIGLGAGLIIPLLPLWFYLRFGVGGGELGVLTVITNALMAISYLAAPELAKRMGAVGSIVSTQLIATGMLVLMPMTPIYGVVAVLYVMRTFLMNLSSPIQSAFMMNIVHPDERALAAALCSPFSGITWGLPNSVGQGIGGAMFERKMLDLPFYLCGMLYALGAVSFFYFFRKYELEKRRQV